MAKTANEQRIVPLSRGMLSWVCGPLLIVGLGAAGWLTCWRTGFENWGNSLLSATLIVLLATVVAVVIAPGLLTRLGPMAVLLVLLTRMGIALAGFVVVTRASPGLSRLQLAVCVVGLYAVSLVWETRWLIRQLDGGMGSSPGGGSAGDSEKQGSLSGRRDGL
jgi:hypothetical protein